MGMRIDLYMGAVADLYYRRGRLNRKGQVSGPMPPNPPLAKTCFAAERLVWLCSLSPAQVCTALISFPGRVPGTYGRRPALGGSDA